MKTQIFLLLAFSLTAAHAQSDKVSFSGHFIAYRPAEFEAQSPSFVRNEENLLFESLNSKTREVVKIVYKHVGYSNISDKILNEAPTVRINVRRDTKCDESYGQFASHYVTVPDFTKAVPDPTKQADVVAPKKKVFFALRFVPKYRGKRISNEVALKCYQLQQDGLELPPLR